MSLEDSQSSIMNQSLNMSNISTKTEEKTRKNHFLCRISQQRRNKISIAKRLSSVEEFCRNIGLRLDHIIITPDNLEKHQDVKITVQNEKLTESFKTLQLLKAKDTANMSDLKYISFKNTLNEILPEKIPSMIKINKMQNKLNNFFKIKYNNYGFYVDPLQKIQFVCQNFIRRNNNYSLDKPIRIKLSADGTSISGTKINLVNFTFELLDDYEYKGEERTSSVFMINILGRLKYFLIV